MTISREQTTTDHVEHRETIFHIITLEGRVAPMVVINRTPTISPLIIGSFDHSLNFRQCHTLVVRCKPNVVSGDVDNMPSR